MSDAAILAAITATAGIGGVAIGGWIAVRGQRKERRHQRVRQQLDEFYGPMLGMRKQIEARSELRAEIQSLDNEEREERRRASRGQRPSLEEISEQREDLVRSIDYDNQQLRTVLLPIYREMRDYFASHISLAEPSTREHLPALIKFIEVWDRSFESAFPGDTLRKVSDRHEEKVKPLYEDLQSQLDRLSEEVKEK